MRVFLFVVEVVERSREVVVREAEVDQFGVHRRFVLFAGRLLAMLCRWLLWAEGCARSGRGLLSSGGEREFCFGLGLGPLGVFGPVPPDFTIKVFDERLANAGLVNGTGDRSGVGEVEGDEVAGRYAAGAGVVDGELLGLLAFHAVDNRDLVGMDRRRRRCSEREAGNEARQESSGQMLEREASS